MVHFKDIYVAVDSLLNVANCAMREFCDWYVFRYVVLGILTDLIEDLT